MLLRRLEQFINNNFVHEIPLSIKLISSTYTSTPTSLHHCYIFFILKIWIIVLIHASYSNLPTIRQTSPPSWLAPPSSRGALRFLSRASGRRSPMSTMLGSVVRAGVRGTRFFARSVPLLRQRPFRQFHGSLALLGIDGTQLRMPSLSPTMTEGEFTIETLLFFHHCSWTVEQWRTPTVWPRVFD